MSVSLALAASGCLVSKAQYDECVNGATAARTAADAQQAQAATQIHDLQERLAVAEQGNQDRDAKQSELTTSSHNLQAQLDEATAMNQQLRGELTRLGKDVDKILADRGTLSKALDDAKSRLDELRKAQEAAEQQADLFRGFAARFKAPIEAGQLKIDARRGRLEMNVNGDLVFDEGKTELRAAGKGVLMEIARALAASETPKTPRRYQITAHVDEEPSPKPRRSKSSWELTAARAVSVVEYLVSLHVPAEALTAAGAGSFDPLGPNDTPENRARNRRLEIALEPVASDLPAHPTGAASAEPTVAKAPK